MSAASLKLKDLLSSCRTLFKTLVGWSLFSLFSQLSLDAPNVVLLDGYDACYYPIVSQRSTRSAATPCVTPGSHRVPPAVTAGYVIVYRVYMQDLYVYMMQFTKSKLHIYYARELKINSKWSKIRVPYYMIDTYLSILDYLCRYD